MSSKISQNNQIEKSQFVLKDIKPNVSPDDKKAAKEYLKVGDFTISIYLNGKGVNLDTAIRLITFFQKRIAQREKAISKVAS